MIFQPTNLADAFLITIERIFDERGFFARTWNPDEFTRHGLNPRVAQCSISFNNRRGTLRGMHLQRPPHAEAKLVRCTKGAIYDVIIDLRPESPTHRCWVGAELSSENRLMMYVPEGFAHGFQTLCDDAEVSYQISESFHSESAIGVRWNDPVFDIDWPLDVTVMAERDRNYPDYTQ